MPACRQTRVTGTWLVALLATLPIVLGGAQTRSVTLPAGPALVWRSIGPVEAGPVPTALGHPSRHGIFFAAAEGAGLWTTTDFGANWSPILDGAPGGSITALAIDPAGSHLVAASRAATASLLYRSDDGGASWRVIGGLRASVITRLALDPTDADRVFAAAVDVTGTATDGVYHSTDGGATFVRVLDAFEGWSANVFIPSGHPMTVLAVGQVPGDSGSGQQGLLVSRDAGQSWQPVRGLAAPAQRPATVDLTAGADGSLWLVTAAGDRAAIYRSIDGGDSWTPAPGEVPPIDTRRAPQLRVTADGDLLLAAGRLYESRDSGRTFAEVLTPIDGAVTVLWTDPTMPGVWFTAGAKGAAVTVNSADTWSRPDNLPGAVVGRLTVDTAFPYRACATTATGASCAPVRPAGRPPTWQPLPATLGERVVPDPLDENVIWGGAGVRFDRRLAQVTHASPVAAFGVAHEPSVPFAFSANGRALLAGTDRVWRTMSGGTAWEEISPVLAVTPVRVSALAVSAIDARTIWAGLDDGRLFVTRAGAPWVETTRPTTETGWFIRTVEPSRFDPSSAYVVATARDGDAGFAPSPGRLLRTRDDGATWFDIGAAIDGADGVFAVREDPYRRGLLFAGTDRSVFVSFDDGEQWQSLELNMPATRVTDLAIKDADLLAATGGRGVWLLEDFSPLRQMTTDVLDADLFLFRPAQTWRLRASADETGSDDQALFTYSLGAPAEEVTLEVVDTTTGDLIRRFGEGSEPAIGPGPDTRRLPTNVGLHRVAWDLRYRSPVPSSDVVPPGTRAVPGTYQVRLTVDGRVARQAITIRLDPRLRTTVVDLAAQRDLGRALDRARAALHEDHDEVRAASDTIALADELNRLASALQQVDARPAARLEAAIEDAIARAGRALGSETR